MAKDLAETSGSDGLDNRDEAEGAELPIEKVSVPQAIYDNRIGISFSTGRLLNEFLRSLGWQTPEIFEFKKVVTLMCISLEEGDYGAALKAFETLKGDLRRIFANQQNEGAVIESGRAVNVDKIQTLLSLNFEDFASWIFTQYQQVHVIPPASDVRAVADVIAISAATSGATTVAANPRRTAPQSTRARTAQASS